MTESEAAVKYREFESLKNRFATEQRKDSKSQQQQQQQQQQHQQRLGSNSKRRHDPRANAPPLVALVEEECLQGEVLESRALIKGKWKHSNLLKSNHLNSPDFDALETASITSCSSAYSSKSESSVLSPPCGSVTELSDAGSCDTFQEYDIASQKSHHRARQHLFKYRKQLSASEDPSSKSSCSDVDVTPNFVRDSTRLWNRALGDWRFDGGGVTSPPDPSSPLMLRVTNEIRVPTPPWTPQGSTDNLLESESRSSLLSSDDSSSVGGWSEPAGERRVPRPGKFLYERSSSTSRLISTFQQTVGLNSSGHGDAGAGGDKAPVTSHHHRASSFSIAGNDEEEEGAGAAVTVVAEDCLTMLDGAGKGHVAGSKVKEEGKGIADASLLVDDRATEGGELPEKKSKSRPHPLEEDKPKSRPRPLEEDKPKSRPRPLGEDKPKSKPHPLEEEKLKSRPRPLEVKSTIRQRAMLFGGTKI